MDTTAQLICHGVDGSPVGLAEAVGAVYRGEADPTDYRLVIVAHPSPTGLGGS